METRCWLVALTSALSVCAPAPADIHYVSPTGGHNPPYTNWTDAATVIQDAVDAAAAGDVVLVTNGSYRLSSEVAVSLPITVKSVYGPALTSIDGQGTTRCLDLGATACLISGFTVTGGRADGAAPGERGAGVYCLDSAPVVSNCTFIGNHANGFGGGMFQGTSMDCVFTNNTSGFHGGGQYWGKAYRTRFLGNTASRKGGGAAEITAHNCLFIGNHAGERGGATFAGETVNCTVSGNSAGIEGGGLYGGPYGGTVTNSVVSGNTAPGGSDILDLYVVFSCSPYLADGARGNVAADPRFVDPGNDDFRLQPGSPCINAGTTVTGPPPWTDLAGLPRVLDGTIDMGAFEHCPPPFIDITSSPTTVHGEVTSHAVGGTNNVWATGYLVWSNAANGAFSSLPCDGLSFQIPGIPITWGTNELSVAATNLAGTAFVDQVIVVRGPMHGGASLTHYVSTNGAAIWPYTNWTTAALSVQDAVDAAAGGDTVLVTNGVYLLSSEIDVPRGITVRSVHGAEVTVIDAQGTCRLFRIREGAILEGLTMRDGHLSPRHQQDYGGGIVCDGGGEVRNCVVSGCRAYNTGAGGIYCRAGGLVTGCTIVSNLAHAGLGGGILCHGGGTVEKCLLVENQAEHRSAIGAGGGGVACVDGGVVRDSVFVRNRTNSDYLGGGGGVSCVGEGLVSNCTFVANQSMSRGGAVYADAYVTVAGCTIVSNRAEEHAGGVYGRFGSVIRDCLVSGNAANIGRGGGLYLDQSTAANCLVISNSAGYGGGGLYCTESVVQHCTVADNAVPPEPWADGGGGICTYGQAWIENSVIYSNEALSGPNWKAYYDTTNEASYSFCCSVPKVSTSTVATVTNDPQFVDAAAGNYRLRRSSPCIDAAGPVPSSLPLDLVGVPRPVDGNTDGSALADIGAYEFWNPTSDSDGDGLGDGDEQARGRDPVYDENWAIAAGFSNGVLRGEANVLDDPAAHGLYTSTSIYDLSFGTLMGASSNGQAHLFLQLQEGPLLAGDHWTGLGPPVPWAAPVDDNKYFYRLWGVP